MYKIDIDSKIPLHIQLFEEIKKDILDNYKPNDKLPSIRKISSSYNISKNTVESAYSQLYAEGYIDSYPKSGYFVCDIENIDLSSKQTNINIQIREKKEFLYDFAPARLDKDTFPLKVFKRLFNKAITDSLDFGKYNDGQGEETLRVEILKYLNHSRGVNAHYDQIVVTSGFSESLGIIAKLLKQEYDTFAIENPGYYIAKDIFSSYGYKTIKIDINENGLDLEKLDKSDAKIVYVTPSHQYPTGVTIPISNRIKLIEWANKNDGYIIEDDYDSELNYINKPIPCLQGLDNQERVIYLGCFAKSLSPVLRISYMILPIPLAKKFQTIFDVHFAKVSLPIQKTMELFLSEGYYEKHLRKIRTLYKKKHDLMKKLLLEYLNDEVKIENYGGGLSIPINPSIPFDMEKLKQLAKEKRVNLYFASSSSGGDWEAIRLGFGGFKEEQIEEAIKYFCDLWNQCKL